MIHIAGRAQGSNVPGFCLYVLLVLGVASNHLREFPVASSYIIGIDGDETLGPCGVTEATLSKVHTLVAKSVLYISTVGTVHCTNDNAIPTDPAGVSALMAFIWIYRYLEEVLDRVLQV